MPAILCLMFLMFLSGNGLAQKGVAPGEVQGRFEKALLARDLKLARTLLPQQKLTGMEKELAEAAVLNARKRADAMIGLAERQGEVRWRMAALVAGLAAILEHEERSGLLGFAPWEDAGTEAARDREDYEGPRATPGIRKLLDRYHAVLESLREQSLRTQAKRGQPERGPDPQSLDEAEWMLRTARVVYVESGLLLLGSGEGLPVPAPLAEEMHYRFYPSRVEDSCLRIYRNKKARPVLEGKLGKADYGRLLAPPPPGVYVLELTSLQTGWTRLRKVMISDLSLTTLVLPTHVIVMALLSGKPAANVELELRISSKDGDDYWVRGQTNAEGIHEFELDESIPYHRAALRGKKGGHQARSQIYSTRGSYGLSRATEVHLTTDRPVYRPGELVQGRILAVRGTMDREGVIRQSALKRHPVSLNFAPDKPWKKVIRGWTDDRGVLAFSYQVPADAEMGGVACEIELGKGVWHSDTAFEIAAWRRAAILLEMKGPTTAKVDAEGLTAQIQARYANGQAAASLRIQIEGSLLGNKDSIDTVLDSDGKLTLPLAFPELKLKEPGTLSLLASLHSPEGKIVQARHRIQLKHAVADAKQEPRRSRAAGVRMELPKEKMPAGSRIPVTLGGKPGSTLLFVIVRDEIQRSQTVLLDAEGKAVLEIDTDAGDWPSLRLFAVAGDGSGSRDEQRLGLGRPGGRIEVRTQGLQKIYRPGEQVEFSVATRDRRGRPIATTLCVAVVDERIFDATRQRPTEIGWALAPAIRLPSGRSAFSARPDAPWELLGAMMQWGATNTPLGMEFGSGSFATPGAGSGAGMTGSPRYGGSTGLREDFRPTAFWVPAARTDAEGLARFSFILPDQLTTWRCTIVAVTDDCRSRTERVQFDTQKPGAVELVLPRILRKGDKILAPLLVASGSQVEAHATEALECSPRPQGMSQKEPTAGPAWPTLELRATGQGPARITLTAKSAGQLTDRVQYAVKVLPDTLPRVRSRSFAIDKATQIQKTRPRGGQQRLILYGNRAALLRSAARYLADYPHGCVEQISSKLLPLLLGKRIDRYLGGAKSKTLASERARRIQEGFAQLRRHLIGPSQGFRWWTENHVDLRMSALALTTLSIAAQAGVDPANHGLLLQPDKGDLLQHAQRLIGQEGRIYILNTESPTGSTQRAGLAEAEIVVACLRYRPDLSTHLQAVRALVTAEQDLPAGLLARAGLALHAAGDGEQARKTLQRLLEGRRVGSETGSPFPGESAVSQTAQSLELLLRVDAQNPQGAPLVTRLLGLSRDGRFGETWGTACALQALLLDQERRSARPITAERKVEIRVDGKASTYDLARAEKTPLVLPIHGDRIDILPSEGVEMHVVLETTSQEPASHHAGWQEPVRVTRYLRRAPQGFGDWSPERIRAERARTKEQEIAKPGSRTQESLQEIGGQATTRDVLEVEIQLESSTTLRYLNLICPIPAGWELVGKGDFGTLHDDEAIAGIPVLVGGRKQSYFLLLRSAMAGEVSWPPVRATCMYQPALSGASIGSRILISRPEQSGRPEEVVPLFSKASKNFQPAEKPKPEVVIVPSEVMHLWDALFDVAMGTFFHGRIRRELNAQITPRLKAGFLALEQTVSALLDHELAPAGRRDLARIVKKIAWFLDDGPWGQGAAPGPSSLYLTAALEGLRTRILPRILENTKVWTAESREAVEAILALPEKPVDRDGLLSLGRAAAASQDLGDFEEFLESIEDVPLWPEMEALWLDQTRSPRQKLRAMAIDALPSSLLDRLSEEALRFRMREEISWYEIEELAECGSLGKKLLLEALEKGRIEDAGTWLQAMGEDILGKLTLAQLLALGDEDGVQEALDDKRFSTERLASELRKPSRLEKRVRLLRTLMKRGVTNLALEDKDAFAPLFRLALAASRGDKSAAAKILERDWDVDDPRPLNELLAKSLLPHYTPETWLLWETWLDQDSRLECLARFGIAELRELLRDDMFEDYALLPSDKLDLLSSELLAACLDSDSIAEEMLPRFARSPAEKDRLQTFILESCDPTSGRLLAQEFYQLTGFPTAWREDTGARFVAEASDRRNREWAFYLRARQPCADRTREELTDLLRQRVGIAPR